jgi:HEAT repeat protein
LVLRIALCFVLGCPVLPRLAHGQPAQNTPNELDSAIATARSKSSVVSPRDVVVIANAGAVQAIPALEEQFRRATDVDTKVSIASGLVKLRDRDNAYWNFLLEQATLAVDSNVPDANFSASQGKMTNLAPELQGWADAHNLSVNTAWRYARYDLPGKVAELATTGDPRGIPLLRRVLQSRNYLMVTYAARGLAKIPDKQSIPLIIAAAHPHPGRRSSGGPSQ